LKALISIAKRTERVFLIGLELKSGVSADARIHGGIGRIGGDGRRNGGGNGHAKTGIARRRHFIGSGKAGEFADYCRANNVDTVIFDDELSPPKAGIWKMSSAAKCWTGRR